MPLGCITCCFGLGLLPRKSNGNYKNELQHSDETKDKFVQLNGAEVLEEIIAFNNGKCNPVRIFSAKELEEATNSSQISEKSDVYSYGAVLFEIVAGQRPYMCGDPFPNKVEQFLQSTEEERMKFIESNVLKQATKDQLLSFIQVIVKCLSASWEDRPDMKEVVQELWRIKKM